MSMEFSEPQHRVLQFLLDVPEPPSVERIVEWSQLDQAQVAAILVEAETRGWVELSQFERHELILIPEARELIRQGLPERRFLEAMTGERLTMREASELAEKQGIALNEVLRWGALRGWLKKDGGQIEVLPEGAQARGQTAADETVLGWLLDSESLFLQDLDARGVVPAEVERLLGKRSNLVKMKVRKVRTSRLTDAGREVLRGPITVRRQKGQLSSEDITSGAWRQIDLRPYDVTLAAETAVPVKPHPFQRMLEDVRRAFLEMGFSEVVSPMVESAFWDFDALYQPQDHPARDMQDTFYLDRPKTAKLPPADLVDRVRRTHEDGWETGSTGWGYRWNPARAQEMVLRTHTTATTIRALAADPNPPRKVFCVGRVFRNENITYKHLPEFHQVDGVIIDKDANFSTLLGTLREFYRKMGFEKIKFKPEFFPYTEPSAGVFVYMESKQRWLELGGSGVFRPEVTRPLGCNVPVLAWGLGLERLAMTLYGIQDIRTLYWTELDWLKEVRLCQ